MAEPTLRESLLAAQQQVTQQPVQTEEHVQDADAAESAPEVATERVPEAPEETTSEAQGERTGRTRDEAGRFTKAEQAAAKLAQAKGGDVAPAVQAPVDGPKPPASWKPATREHWQKLPPEVRAEVTRREKELAGLVQEAASHRKTAEAFERTLQPYRAFIQGEPTQVVGNLLQTAVQLQTGTPAQKAAIAAQIISGYGVDIEQLAAALDGKAPTSAQQQPQEFRDPRFDQFLGQLQQAQQQRAQQSKAAAGQQVETFAASHEFFEDVREDMADFIAVARQRGRGREMSLEEAYERACLANPDVRGLYQQRKAAHDAANAKASTQRARAAASSIRHEPTAPAADTEPASLRDSILAAMKTSGRR